MTSQEIFQKVVKESMDTYMNFLRAPLTYYQQVREATDVASRQGLKHFQKASESFQESTQQGETVATTMKHALEQAQAQDPSPPPEVF